MLATPPTVATAASREATTFFTALSLRYPGLTWQFAVGVPMSSNVRSPDLAVAMDLSHDDPEQVERAITAAFAAGLSWATMAGNAGVNMDDVIARAHEFASRVNHQPQE